jgi:hypothetical protein
MRLLKWTNSERTIVLTRHVTTKSPNQNLVRVYHLQGVRRREFRGAATSSPRAALAARLFPRGACCLNLHLGRSRRGRPRPPRPRAAAAPAVIFPRGRGQNNDLRSLPHRWNGGGGDSNFKGKGFWGFVLLPALRLSALMDLYIHPLYVIVSKILFSILNSSTLIHPLYHPLSTLSII